MHCDVVILSVNCLMCLVTIKLEFADGHELTNLKEF